MSITWLGEPRCDEIAYAGGKAARLSVLAASHRVPVGFCLTTKFFDHRAIEDVSGLSRDLSAPYRRLGQLCGIAEPSVAVRSSSVEEDGAKISFAGQHESFLNVEGLDRLAEAIVRCWRSAQSHRALEYRRQRGIADSEIRMAVLIQRFIAADISVVAFSANPVTCAGDEVVINANWGAGTTIVDGAATPDTYVIRKRDRAVVSRQIGDKQRVGVPARGGIRDVQLPQSLRSQPVLDDTRLLEIARLALTLEERFVFPVDIECAYFGGELFILQCRPITGLPR